MVVHSAAESRCGADGRKFCLHCTHGMDESTPGLGEFRPGSAGPAGRARPYPAGSYSPHLGLTPLLLRGMVLFVVLGSLSVWFSLATAVHPVLAANWSPEMQVNVDDDYSDWSPGVAIDTTGRVWVTWGGIDGVEGDEDVHFRYWEDGGWGSQGVVNPPNQVPDRFPELCSGKHDGVPWCMWAGWDTLVGAYDFLVSRWVGDGWGWPETVFVGGGRYDAYDIVARDTSLVWAVWSTRTIVEPTHKDIFARARVDGVWGAVEQIELTYGHEGEPRGALDSQDRLWVVWQSDSLDRVVIQSCVRDEVGWGGVLHVAGDSMGCLVPWIAIDGEDVPWVVWARGDELGGSDVWSARWAGTGWEQLGKVSESGETGDVGFGNPVIRSVKGSGPLFVWWGVYYLVFDTM